MLCIDYTWFRDLVERLTKQRIAEIIKPPPEPVIATVRARASQVVVHEYNPNIINPGEPAMASVPVQAPALSASVSLFGIEFSRAPKPDGSPGDLVEPNESRVIVTSSDPAVVTASYSNASADGPHNLSMVPNSSAVEGAVATITVSANETGTADDLTIDFTIGPVTIAGIGVNSANVVVHET